MKLSVVTAMYRSERFVAPFHAALTERAQELTDDYEIIFVDDGSPDGSAKAVEALTKTDPRVRLVKLSKNFGQSVAMLAGMRKAKGERVYTSDIDLEDPPELLTRFDAMMKDDPKIESVYGFMATRKGTALERWLGGIFYFLLDFLTRDRIPSQVWSRLMTRKYLDAVLSYSEYHLFWSGIFHAVGFKQVAVPVDRKKTGQTSYNYRKKIQLALSAVTSFSTGPLYLIFLIGLFVSLSSVVAAVALLVIYLRGQLVPGWASIVLSILFTGGLTNLSIGLIGIYVGRIFMQSKNRPHFFVEKEL